MWVQQQTIAWVNALDAGLSNLKFDVVGTSSGFCHSSIPESLWALVAV
jgi:hypothetical protein